MASYTHTQVSVIDAMLTGFIRTYAHSHIHTHTHTHTGINHVLTGFTRTSDIMQPAVLHTIVPFSLSEPMAHRQEQIASSPGRLPQVSMLHVETWGRG
jgi:hypothetical protein